MNRITFKCETITPMFLGGADGQPELRVPSIKGALRFWWRAMNGHLRIEELRRREGAIFGSAEGGRSKLILHVSTDVPEKHISSYTPTPHKNGFTKAAFDSGTPFSIALSLLHDVRLDDHKIFDFQDAVNLFLISMTLGGLGGRARRGFGSILVKAENNEIKTIQAQNLKQLATQLQHFSKYFSISQNSIINTYNGSMERYPWIREIQFGTSCDNNGQELLRQIGNTSSNLLRNNGRSYEASLGHASRGRFASPIYVSISKKEEGYFPIITSLNTIPDYNHQKDLDLLLQRTFKEKILD